jgi:hypothetical protein
MRASKTSGLWPVSRDRDLVRVGAAFADLNARLLAEEAPPGLSDTTRNILLDLWWRTIEDATPIPPEPSEAGEIKTTRLLVVMRETHLNGRLRDLAQSVARNLTERHGTKRVSAVFGCETAGIGSWH